MTNEPDETTVGSALMTAYDVSTLSFSHLTYLNALFTAISDANKELSTTHTLASIGKYLTDGWATDMDCQGGELKLELKPRGYL